MITNKTNIAIDPIPIPNHWVIVKDTYPLGKGEDAPTVSVACPLYVRYKSADCVTKPHHVRPVRSSTVPLTRITGIDVHPQLGAVHTQTIYMWSDFWAKRQRRDESQTLPSGYGPGLVGPLTGYKGHVISRPQTNAPTQRDLNNAARAHGCVVVIQKRHVHRMDVSPSGDIETEAMETAYLIKAPRDQTKILNFSRYNDVWYRGRLVRMHALFTTDKDRFLSFAPELWPDAEDENPTGDWRATFESNDTRSGIALGHTLFSFARRPTPKDRAAMRIFASQSCGLA